MEKMGRKKLQKPRKKSKKQNKIVRKVKIDGKRRKYQKKLKITDLNFDVSEHLCGCLTLVNLANMCDTNIQFREAAQLVYRLKFREQKLHITPQTIGFKDTMLDIEPEPYSFDGVLRILRNFGRDIAALSIELDDDLNELEWDCIGKDIVHYCSQTLKEIELINVPDYTLYRGSEMHFPAVENVKLIKDKEIRLKTTQLNRCFPNMKQLSFIDCSTTNPNCMDFHFPNLRKLFFSGDLSNLERVNEQMIKRCIDLNPQLRELDLDFFYDTFEIFDASRTYQFDELRMQFIDVDSNNERIHFDDVRSLKLTIYDSMEISGQIPITFGRLDELTVDFGMFLADFWLEFIIANHNLTALEFRSFEMANNYGIKTEFWLRIANALKGLKTFKIEGYLITAADLYAFVTECRTLENFEIWLYTDELQYTQFKSGWETEVHGSIVMFKRFPS